MKDKPSTSIRSTPTCAASSDRSIAWPDWSTTSSRSRGRGRGIPEDELSGLARPFARGSQRARTFSGMGIGLYLARLVVEGHGGSLTLASPGEDRGTTVTMKLPRGAAHGEPVG